MNREEQIRMWENAIKESKGKPMNIDGKSSATAGSPRPKPKTFEGDYMPSKPSKPSEKKYK
jgi:hypothetical protein